MTSDGLYPPGEQMGLWDEDPDAVETVVHKVTYTADSWWCACGAGRTVEHGKRARAAALIHIRAVRRRINDRP